MALAGLRKVVDFQDTAYGHLYLDRVAAIFAKDDAGRDHLLTREAAKYIANAMAYDDVIKVADLKTRRQRFARIGSEMQLSDDQQLRLTEFFHPRAEEIAGLLPAGLGARIETSEKWMAALTRLFDKGRRLRSDRLHHFAMLYFLGGRRKWRLKTLRHAHEERHLKSWLDTATGLLTKDYDLAVEVIRCRRLIKGYSDTHSRGLSKFDRVIAVSATLAGRDDAADWLRRLREAALQDEAGTALNGALKTVNSFVESNGQA
jgi:indolepyruvate ferredoxin oxidoreductase beta subunit